MSKPSVERKSIQEATAEAESRQLDYDPAIRATYIRMMVRDISEWVASGEAENSIRQRASEFVEQYPELFKKLLAKQDLGPMQSMLTMLDKMADGSLSQHQASVIIGKKLVDRYVTPQLNGTAPDK
jgi:hypothetical protein